MHACMVRMWTFVSVAVALYTIQRCIFVSHSVACMNRCVVVLRRTEQRTQNIYDRVPSLVCFGRAIFVAWILLAIVVCLCRLSLSCALWLYALAWWKRAKRIAFKYPKKNQQNALNIKKQSLWKSNRAVFFCCSHRCFWLVLFCFALFKRWICHRQKWFCRCVSVHRPVYPLEEKRLDAWFLSSW